MGSRAQEEWVEEVVVVEEGRTAVESEVGTWGRRGWREEGTWLSEVEEEEVGVEVVEVVWAEVEGLRMHLYTGCFFYWSL